MCLSGAQLKALCLFISLLLVLNSGTSLFAAEEDWQTLHLEVARLYSEGDTESAIRTAEAALKRAKTEFGPSHLNTAKSMNNLANLYFSAGRLDEAGWMYEDALAVEERELGRESPSVADTLYNFSMLLFFMKEKAKARLQLERSLEIHRAQNPVDLKAIERVENALAQLEKGTEPS